MASDTDRMERLVALAKRRGFIFPSSEIYGGLNGFWDYGPLGVELKRNVKQAWWDDIVRRPPTGPDGEPIEMVGLDCSIIMNPTVWEASGHVVSFNDPLVDCKECKARYRADTFERLILLPVDAIPQRIDNWTDYRMHNLQPLLDRGGNPTCLAEPGATLEDMQRLVRRVLDSKRAKLVPKPVADAGKPADRTEVFVEDGQDSYFLARPLSSARSGDRCPHCGGELTDARKFNMMFKTYVGALEDSSSVAHLRPETAQGIFVNFKNVLDTQRLKLPFGIAQIGKAFRNEINPRNYTFRSREFEQMEIEFFCHPDQAAEWYTWWRDARYAWYVRHGLTSDRLRLRDHEEDELAHYAEACADVEYDFPFGVSELEGIANRTDFDLKAHQDRSGRDMAYFDEERWQQDAGQYKPEHYGGDKKAAKQAAAEAKQGMPYRFVPYVIEPSGGVDRAALAFLCEAYDEDEAPDEKGNPQQRTVLRLHPRLAPVKVAVFPLVKKDGMPEKARALYEACREQMTAFYDEKGAVGRRYRRQDEAGTPFCVTVDGQTNEDGTVTVRDRDSMEQVRVPSDGVVAWLKDRLAGA